MVSLRLAPEVLLIRRPPPAAKIVLFTVTVAKSLMRSPLLLSA